MSSTFLIPLQNTPQNFEIALAGASYSVTCKWNDSPDAGWVIDLADAITDTPIATNIALVTGVNLLSGLEYLGINGQLYVLTDGNPEAVPTLDNLGVESNVYFVTDLTDNG